MNALKKKKSDKTVNFNLLKNKPKSSNQKEIELT
jgi:hypothetical protein